MKLKQIFPNESIEDTSKFIEENRNWSVEKQCYKIPPEESNKIKLTDCEIYRRGEYIIVESNGVIFYSEWANTNYPFFQMAIDFMELDKPEDWKTVGKLIALRMGIRQTEVNHCGYVEDFLEGVKMTQATYNKFMRAARAQDKQHHGQHTF